ncbi:hypothetical protein SeMB42_g07366, partial [Synchytrium endobioticum]
GSGRQIVRAVLLGLLNDAFLNFQTCGVSVVLSPLPLELSTPNIAPIDAELLWFLT